MTVDLSIFDHILNVIPHNNIFLKNLILLFFLFESLGLDKVSVKLTCL